MPLLRSFCCLVLTLLLSASLYAQQTLKGIVLEREAPLAFANVLLHDARDSSLLLQPVFTDSNGRFSITLPEPFVPCFAEFSMLGYKPVFLPVTADAKDNNALRIVLQAEGKTLEGVTITEQKALIERKPDRTIFNASQSIAAIGSDVYDLLKKTPGVQIRNGEVNIVGKSTVNVMINDRQVQLTGSELEAYLRSLPAGDVSRIEVITAPPARYDAEGNSGIINIVTRKKKNNGFNGSLDLSYEQRTRPSLGMDGLFNFRQGKLNVYGTFSGSKNRFISKQQTNTFYPGQEQELMLNQDNRPGYTYAQAGIDYELSPGSTIGLLYTNGTSSVQRDEVIRIKARQQPSGIIDSMMNTDAYATEKALRNVINLNYEWKLDTGGRKLMLNAEYFHRNSDKTRDFTTGNYFSDGSATGSSSDNRTNGNQTVKITTLRADLEWPTRFADFSAGGKATFIRNYSDNLFRYLQGGNYLTDGGKTNAFDYEENTQAAYVSTQRSWGKWQAQAGLRAEYTQTKGISRTLNQTNTNDYLKLFPTAYIQYKLNDDHSWNLNYTRRISRPSFWNMNPFRVYSTATAYEQGNPFLQPAFSNNIELGYTYKSMLVFTAFYQTVDQFATRVSQIDTVNNTFFFLQANAGSELQCGFTGSLTYNPLPFWETSTQLSGVYNRFTASFYNTEQQSSSRLGFYVETSHTFTLDKAKTLMLQLHYAYFSGGQDDVDIQKPNSTFDFGGRVLLFRKKVTLSAFVSDLFKTDISEFTNVYNGTYQHRYFDTRSLRIALGWKFGNNELKARKERKANEDTRR